MIRSVIVVRKQLFIDDGKRRTWITRVGEKRNPTGSVYCFSPKAYVLFALKSHGVDNNY